MFICLLLDRLLNVGISVMLCIVLCKYFCLWIVLLLYFISGLCKINSLYILKHSWFCINNPSITARFLLATYEVWNVHRKTTDKCYSVKLSFKSLMSHDCTRDALWDTLTVHKRLPFPCLWSFGIKYLTVKSQCNPTHLTFFGKHTIVMDCIDVNISDLTHSYKACIHLNKHSLLNYKSVCSSIQSIRPYAGIRRPLCDTLMADLGIVSHTIVQHLNPYLNITAFCLSCLDWDYTSFGPLKRGHGGDCCAQCVLAVNICLGGGWEVLFFVPRGFLIILGLTDHRPLNLHGSHSDWQGRVFLLSFPLQRGGRKKRIFSYGLIMMVCLCQEIY